MADRGKRTGRAEWKKRVARWGESGLSAEEFAAEIGVNAGTLRQWKYALNREERGSGRRTEAPGVAADADLVMRHFADALAHIAAALVYG